MSAMQMDISHRKKKTTLFPDELEVVPLPLTLGRCRTKGPSIVERALTLKACVAERFAAEALVILDSVDDDGPSQNVCKNENVGLLQAGSRLRRGKHDTVRKKNPTDMVLNSLPLF